MIGVFDHPWLGGLFGDDAANMIWSDERQLAHMLAFEAAYARALGAAGVVDTKTANAAARLIREFEPDITGLRTGTATDGLVVPDLVRQLKADAGPLAAAIHSGSTSQDVLDTALALCLRDTTALLVKRLDKLAARLDRLTTTFGGQPLMGRTRMQAALPITVGDRIATWRGPLDGHRDRLEQIKPRVEMLQLGGPVGDRRTLGSGADEIVQSVATELGLAPPDRTWHTTRDGVAEYAGLLSLITASLGKMGQDMCLMAQQGLDELSFADGGGSSAMPHKQNPVLPELLVTLAHFNAAQLSGMHHAVVHEQERSGSAWALEWMILPQMAVAAARSISAGTTACENITSIGQPKG